MLSKNELRDYLSARYSSDHVRELRTENINSFNNIDRKGLKYGELEKRILLYSSKINEKVYIQFPGKESSKGRINTYDFRPKLQFSEELFAPDTKMEDIWDVIDQIANSHSADLPILAAIIFRLQNMYGYTCVKQDYYAESVDIKKDKVVPIDMECLEWNYLDLPDEVWEKLEEMFNDDNNPLRIRGVKTSFEGFIKYLDLLLQNEDCKYYLRNGKVEAVGRKNTCGTVLSIIQYYEGGISLAKLLGRFRTGVAAFKVADYPKVTDNIITL